MTESPLAYLRGCAIQVSYSDQGKLVLTPTVGISPLVARKARQFASRNKAEILADLAAEEAEQNGRARSRQ